MPPVSKLSKLRAAAAENDWRGAMAIAARFPDLGAHKVQIMRAWEAYTRPDFQRQLGRDQAQLIESGIQALRERYHV